MNAIDKNRVGILGVGHFGAALTRGLVRSGVKPGQVILSPRGGAVQPLVAELGVEKATDNAAVVARADIVFLSVRPNQAAEAVMGLPWRKSQLLISVCAGIPIGTLAAATGGGPDIARAMPMTSAAIGASPTVVFPGQPRAIAVLERFGRVFPLAEEGEFEIATAVAVAYTLCHDLVSRTAEWAAGAGLDRQTSRLLSAAHFESAARAMAEGKETRREALIESLVTEGGVAEAAYGSLRAGRYDETWEAALAAALARVRRLHPKG